MTDQTFLKEDSARPAIISRATPLTDEHFGLTPPDAYAAHIEFARRIERRMHEAEHNYAVTEAARVKATSLSKAAGGAALIAEERARQIAKEGWTPDHDDEHTNGELADSAACYAALGGAQARGRANEPWMPPPAAWPWDQSWWKPQDQMRNLVRAGALLAAEIDRLLRKKGAP